MNNERYNEFVTTACEIIGFTKPIEVIRLCQLTISFILPYENRIHELEKEVELLKAQKEKMKSCSNCNGKFLSTRCKLCKDYSSWELSND